MKKIFYLLVVLIILLPACKKDTSIGADILPQDDLLNVKYTDTLTVYSKTQADTFLRTDKLAKNYLGVINDSRFGFQKASVVMELDKPTGVFDDSLNTTYTIDSVVLFLKYNSVYGDTTVPQNFTVSTISNNINENSVYYSNETRFSATNVIGDISNYFFTPTSNPVHISSTDTTGVTGVLRIKLNSSLGSTILNLGQTVLRDSASFKNAFPGILVENATNTGSAMAEIDLNSIYSYLVIFYKDKYNNAKEMKMYSSIIRYVNGISGTRVNGVNLFSSSLSSGVQDIITAGLQSDSINYILGQGGTLVKLSMPTISALGNIAVNKALISVTQIIQNSNQEFTRPVYMVLLKRNASGNLDLLPTADGVGIIDTSGTDLFGNKIARYSFNISKYVQAVANGTELNTDLYMATYRFAGTDGTVNVLNSITSSNSVINIGYTPSRVIIAGSNYSDTRYRLRLNLTYTLIK